MRHPAAFKQKRVGSTRLPERRLKKRRSPKPVIAHRTDSSERVKSRMSSKGFDPNDPLRLFLLGPETKQLLTVQEENELIREVQVRLRFFPAKYACLFKNFDGSSIW